MKKLWMLGAFLLVAAAQQAAPWTLIVRHETVLRTGERLKFRVRPFDPVDVMRGRYVSVTPEAREVPFVAAKGGSAWMQGVVYVRLEKDADGFARAIDASATRPRQGLYVRAQGTSYGSGKAYLTWPFERYFMEESAAPEAERIYRQHAAASARDAWLVVRVKDGWAVTEDLIVGGKPIREAIAAGKK